MMDTLVAELEKETTVAEGNEKELKVITKSSWLIPRPCALRIQSLLRTRQQQKQMRSVPLRRTRETWVSPRRSSRVHRTSSARSTKTATGCFPILIPETKHALMRLNR